MSWRDSLAICRMSSRTRKKASTTCGVPLLARPGAEDGVDLFVGHALAVGAVAAHRVEGVGHGHDPGGERDPLAGQPVRIAAAVPRLVVVQHDRQHVVELLQVAEDAVADLRRAS